MNCGSTILDTMKILHICLVNKLMHGFQGDGFRTWVHECAPLNSQWLMLKMISGCIVRTCWVLDN